MMKLLDTVALLENMPMLNLYSGQVGTIVEEYESDVFEVEFVDVSCKGYCQPPVRICHFPVAVAAEDFRFYTSFAPLVLNTAQ